MSNTPAPSGAEAGIVQDVPLRFYVIVPETVQTAPFGGHAMEAGRLMAQSFHLGRVVESRRALHGIKHEDITCIVLSVRNTLELEKVFVELQMQALESMTKTDPKPLQLSLYKDYNPDVYDTPNRVFTALCVGPTTKDAVRSSIGHLELY